MSVLVFVFITLTLGIDFRISSGIRQNEANKTEEGDLAENFDAPLDETSNIK